VIKQVTNDVADTSSSRKLHTLAKTLDGEDKKMLELYNQKKLLAVNSDESQKTKTIMPALSSSCSETIADVTVNDETKAEIRTP
jgi:hypothetical protein